MRLIIVVLLSFCTTIRADCGYNVCHKTDLKKLNIHLIPHSHDDVGWWKTPDNYYIQQVREIITNVVKSLELSTDRRFIQVESYFFHRWWSEQNEERKNVVRQLVSTGRLVFINGGWTVNDEGAAHYNNIIDQMTYGLRFLDEEFGKCGRPKISWQIDPFGATKEMASLYAQMAFDAHVVNRGPNPKGEYIWRGSKDLGSNSDIFTSVLHSHYTPPKGFDFESEYEITESNKASKAAEFVKIAQNYSQDYSNTNQVMITMGMDFRYQHSERWFTNMDKLIKEISANYKDVDVFYSTPNCYFYELNKLNKTYSHREVDYLNYWVGYYTSRPTLKREDRVANNYLQASKQLDVLARLNPNTTRAYLDESRNELAIMTHHDAITGTSPQDTADDYSRRLFSGFTASRAVIQKSYKRISNNTESTEQVFCDGLNTTECTLTENTDRIAVTIYNPIARVVSQYIRVPVISDNYDVFDGNGVKVANKAVLPVSKAVLALPGRKSNATHELVFKANLLPLGFVTYLVKKINTQKKRSIDEIIRKKRANVEMKGKSFTLQIDEQSGALISITMNGKTHALRQSFKYYLSGGGVKNKEDSGSYHFCPNGTSHDFPTQKLISKTSSGSVHEIQQEFSDYVKQTVRTYEDEDYIEFDWSVGPIPIGDNVGKEVITRFESDLSNEKVFYTDANGRQMVRRVFDTKSVSCKGVDSTIAGNWYPIYSKIFIRDEKQGLQMSVLNDRTQGGSSLMDGSVELMVHRRLTTHGSGSSFIIDEKGVDGKGLIVRGKHYLFFKPISESAKHYRDVSQRLFLEPILSFAKYDSTESDFHTKHVTSFSGLNKELPENVHLLTLENWKKNEILVRLEHFYESLDNNDLSKAVDVNLQNLFKGFKVLDIAETNLAANELLSEYKRLKWNSNESFSEELHRRRRAVDFNIHLTSQQIRTFIVTVENNIETEEKCDIKWVNVNENKIPSNALMGGLDNKSSPLYICRHKVLSELIPGTANSQIGCHLSFGGTDVDIKNETYEVLVGKNVEWVPRHGTDPLPRNAFESGKTSKGDIIYIGRCALHDSKADNEVMAKSVYWLFYPYGEPDHKNCDNNEILVCNQ